MALPKDKDDGDGLQKDKGPQLYAQIAVPKFSLDELKRKTRDFGSDAMIGEGSHGRVYHAELDNGTLVAVKKLNGSFEAISHSRFSTMVSKMSTLKHENFVQLCGYCDEENTRIMVYEYATWGSLHDYLHGTEGVEARPALDWMQRVRIAIDAAQGLDYLHYNSPPSIIHGDINSKNVLLFEDLRAKIADFNLSNRAGNLRAYPHWTTVSRTSGYHAPEYAVTGRTHECDVYSFGVVLLELLTGRKPFDHTKPQGEQSLVTWAKTMLSEGKVKQCVDPRLNYEDHSKAIDQLAKIVDLCVRDRYGVRAGMKFVVIALQQLLEPRYTRPPDTRPPDTSNHKLRTLGMLTVIVPTFAFVCLKLWRMKARLPSP